MKAILLILFFSISSNLFSQPYPKPDRMTKQSVENAEIFTGLTFTDVERDSMLDGLKRFLASYEQIRGVHLKNTIPPALVFNPIPAGLKIKTGKSSFLTTPAGKVTLPARLEEIAFYSVGQLSELIKSRKITSVQLTTLYLERLKKYGPKLECVVTLTESLALTQARRADSEIAAGKYRGPLHGIPYGAKDLLATKGIRTTWGSVPFQDQMIDEDATVIKRLELAGAVLVAKLTMGELAWGDVWFGGRTRNPWNLEQGSSGSSAGSAAATAAGLVAFAIGTETWGSIVSPSNRCGTTGLRPTYGRVSRTGAMALSWSMNKIGPICRTVEDCALVFNAIHGPDGIDQMLYDVPFNYSSQLNLKKLKVGYLQSDFDSAKVNKEQNDATLEKLRSMGVRLIPVELPKLPVESLSFILSAEAAAAFDELTRSGKDDLLVRQIKNAWPNVFRSARFIPAVEYIQANRVRYLLIQEMARLMEKVDVYVAPSVEGNNSLVTNLTGHPCVVVPNGFTNENTPASITFIGQLFDEGTLLAFTKAYQDVNDFHLKYPTLPE
ncbi:MAG: amidase [Bacteroidetes bacterium]|nr:amidase [Bacteroidota bacterium]